MKLRVDTLRSWPFLLAISIMVCGVWVIWAMYSPKIYVFMTAGQNTDRSGTWGDGFGALNTLFTGLAFLGALAAIMTQGEAIEQQQKDQHRQRFDANLFELFNLLQNARSALTFNFSRTYYSSNNVNNKEIKTGHMAILAANLEILYWIRQSQAGLRLSRNNLAAIYTQRVHRRREAYLGAYFRTIYTILKRIDDDAVLTTKEKEDAGNLLRTQMTSNEIFLASLNALNDYAGDFQRLLIKFRMLKYLPAGSRRRLLERVYPPEAFAPRND